MTRIPDSTRAAIEAALRLPGAKLAGIARSHGVSPSYVKAVRAEAGLAPLPTEQARASAKKAGETAALLADSRRLERGKQSTATLEAARAFLGAALAPELEPRAIQSMMVAYGIAVDKSLQLERYDSESNVAAKSAIMDLVDRLSGSGADLVESPPIEEPA